MNDDSSKVSRDEEGYLFEPDDWTPQLAIKIAEEEDLSLTDEHWMILAFVREYYVEHGITPDIRHVAKYLGQQQDCDKKQGKARIFELFPYGYVRQTCKLAGMKRPRAWSTG